MKVLTLFLVLCWPVLAMAEDPSTRKISKAPVSELELQILEFGDSYSAGKVLGRLQVLHKVKGLNAIRPALPAVKARLDTLQKTNSRTSFEHDLVAFLCKFEDTSLSTQQLLIDAVKRGDNTIAAYGLVKFGSAIDSLIIYLYDTDRNIRGAASRTLNRMYRRKSDLFTTAQIDSIKARHLTNLKLYAYKGTHLIALGVFGDRSVIPVLKDIADTDTYPVDGSGRNPNKHFARWAIAQINAK